MDLGAQPIDSILNLLNLLEVILLALLCQPLELLSLRLLQLLVPHPTDLICDLALGHVRPLLLHLIEVLVLEDLVSGKGVLRENTLSNLLL